jgi:hypothetical protein
MPVIEQRARPRRWPVALVVGVLALALTLTGLLVARDRQNADAATGSVGNAGQDAVALATLNTLVRTLDLDAAVRLAGVQGLRAIALHDVTTLVVTPLGGTMEPAVGQWTLALGGGFACLTWHGVTAAAGAATAARGECASNPPLVATTAVSPTRFLFAERLVAQRERAAVAAATAAAGLANGGRGTAVRFSVPSLAVGLGRVLGLSAWAMRDGVDVATATSSACLQPTVRGARVRVTEGACR